VENWVNYFIVMLNQMGGYSSEREKTGVPLFKKLAEIVVTVRFSSYI